MATLSIDYQNIDSDCIYSVSYNSNEKIMRLSFYSNPIKKYLYHADDSIAIDFLQAPSKGKYYHKVIKTRSVNQFKLRTAL
jgi:hypothetical protein